MAKRRFDEGSELQPRASKRRKAVEKLWEGNNYTPSRATSDVRAQTEAQGHYILSIKSNILTLGVGPAGTGKTYVCAALAAEALRAKQCERLIITRPAIEACENLGFLPGEIDQKFAPYFEPFKDVLDERLGPSHVEGLMKAKRIVAAPLAYMRGKSFKNAWVILDEAQNTTPQQMMLFLTRIGEHCTVIVNGDPDQKDIKGTSGLSDAEVRLKDVPGVRVVRFDRDDIVRSGFVRHMIDAYSQPYL
jgi:phosphate starvation-inducible protein PhoH and related proteins